MNENYGMSSRYALQFQFLTVGILLTAALAWEQIGKKVTGLVLASACAALVIGSGVTTWHEAVVMAPHREDYGEKIASVALRFQETTDEELRETFDFRKSREDSGERCVRLWKFYMNNDGTYLVRCRRHRNIGGNGR